MFKTSDYDADYLYDGTNKDYVFSPNGKSVVTFEDGKYNAIFKPDVETAPETAGQGWAQNSNNKKLGSQLQFWIPTNGKDNDVDGFSGFSCANNSMGVISFKMKTNMTDSFTLSVTKLRYPQSDWTGWGTSEIKIFNVGAYSDNGIVLKGGINAGTTLTTIPVKDGWSEEFEVDIYIQLKDNNTISLTYYVNGTKCGTFADKTMTIDTYDIRALYISGWTYTANTGFIFDDLSIKYTSADYTCTGSNQDSSYVYYTNAGGTASISKEDKHSVTITSDTRTQPQFWFPSNAKGQGFSGFSCENNSLGVISFKMKTSMNESITLAAAKERNASDFNDWSTSSINILSVSGITDGTDKITIYGGLDASTEFTTITVGNDGWSEEFEVIIFIKLKEDKTITLTYYVNGTNYGSYTRDLEHPETYSDGKPKYTIDSYDIRAFYLNGWSYTENTGFTFDDLAISYADNGHFDHHPGLRAVDGIEGRYENICTCCGTVYGYVDNLYHLTYEDCGAAGNGIADDSEAIRRTHEMANYAGLPVIASSSTRTYYIGKITETITIKTDTDWNDAKFILDDSQIHWRDSSRSLDVFTVASDTPATSLPVPTGLALTKGQTNIGMTFAEPCMILIENSDEKIYKRYGANANGGVTKQELILVDADGNVDLSTPIQYNYAKITKITMYSIDDTPLRVGNATVTTVAPNPKDPNNPYYDPNFQNSNDNGYFRGLSVKRSNTTIYDVEHIVENEMMTVELDRDGNGTIDKWGDGDKSYGVTYYGFFNFVKCYNVTLQDCIVEGHQAYSFMDTYTDTNGTVQSTRNETGSYDIKAEYCVDITFDNIDQYENAATGEVITNRFMYHGIMGSNWCRNMVMNDCYIDRFDAHQGMHNATITNSTLGFGILVIGGGTLYVGNTYSHAVQGFIHLRTDYNSIFDGDVIIKDCTIGNSENSNSLIIGNWLKHDAGLPNNMINNLVINGLTIDNNSNSISIFNIANAAKSALTDTTNPLILPESIVVTGVKHSNGSYVNVTASKYSGDAFADYNISTDLNSVCNSDHKNFVVSYDSESGKPASYTCTRCGYEYILDGGMLDQSNITPNGNSTHSYTSNDGHFEVINTGTKDGQHQIWVPNATVAPELVDFTCANNSTGFLSFKVRTNDVMNSDSSQNIGTEFKINANRGTGNWANPNGANDGWLDSSVAIFKIKPLASASATELEITGYKGNSLGSIPVALVDGWTDWIDVVIKIKLTSKNQISVDYYINGDYVGTIAGDMKIWTYDITSLYVSGKTQTAGEGYMLDDLIFGYTNNTSVADEDIVVNYVANNDINDTLLGFAGTSTGTVVLPTVTRSDYDLLGWYTAASSGTKIGDAGATYKPNGDVTLYAQWDKSCITGETRVTLSDGSKKAIKDITYSDELLVWDFFNGNYTTVPSALIANHGYGEWYVITMTFEDGTVIEAVNSHAFFNADLNEFVMITPESFNEYIGHSFVKATEDGTTTIKLVDCSVNKEYTDSYSLVSSLHYNFIVEDVFSLTKSVFNLIAGIEVGDNLMYDVDTLNADIEEYGLYTYDDFADYITEEQFNAFNGAYLKISVGKGYITYEEIIELVKRFVNS